MVNIFHSSKNQGQRLWYVPTRVAESDLYDMGFMRADGIVWDLTEAQTRVQGGGVRVGAPVWQPRGLASPGKGVRLNLCTLQYY